ncbi:hypothetical protein B0T25DRAFT_552976 [Lasiosphaeria hispida]|uniref:Uncharacterized protein n=1 Tax=Lasiosphaeria hispida TaxID=260671 RepID=A0AAJ0MB05_9PEZI|nr:hypothetical protein B0T25DRAFT_552976 [Lasiosphaeria hispida]
MARGWTAAFQRSASHICDCREVKLRGASVGTGLPFEASQNQGGQQGSILRSRCGERDIPSWRAASALCLCFVCRTAEINSRQISPHVPKRRALRLTVYGNFVVGRLGTRGFRNKHRIFPGSRVGEGHWAPLGRQRDTQTGNPQGRPLDVHPSFPCASAVIVQPWVGHGLHCSRFRRRDSCWQGNEQSGVMASHWTLRLLTSRIHKSEARANLSQPTPRAAIRVWGSNSFTSRHARSSTI